MKSRRHNLVAVVILTLLWGLFAWRFLTPDAADRLSFPEGDFTHHFYVFRTFAYQELAAGRFPLWMDCVFAGSPFQADPQAALFYPGVAANLALHWLLGAQAFSLQALHVEALLHLWFASLLTYAFLRGETRSWLAALLGAVVFAYGGYLTSYPPLQLAVLEVATWLPLALWGARGLAGRARATHFSALVAALSLALLGGHPQTFLHLGYATLAYYAYRVWVEGTPWKVALGRLTLSGALVLGLCAVQLLPSLQYVRLSTRADIPFEKSATGFPVRDIVQLVLPGVVSFWQPLYVGIWPLAMAFLGALCSRHRDRWFWIGLAIVALLFSFGRNLFAYEAAYLAAPGYALFRGQERHAFLTSFALSMLAALGSDVLLQPLTRSRRRLTLGVARVVSWTVPVIGFLFLLVVLLSQAQVGDWTRASFSERLGGLLLALAATALLLHGRLRAPRRRLAVSALALALVVVDLFTVNRIAGSAPRDPFPPEPTLEAARSDSSPFFRVQEDGRLPGHTVCMNGLHEIWGMTPIWTEEIDTFVRRAPEEVRWALLGVRYVVTWRAALHRPDGTPVPAEMLYSTGEGRDAAYAWRLPGEPRYAWVVRDLWTAEDEEELYALLAKPEFNPHGAAVVMGHLPSPSPMGGPDVMDAVSLVERTPTRVHVHADLGAPGVLVLSQVHYPGWRVTVNGGRDRLLQVNGLLPAVVLSSGVSDIVLTFQPPLFVAGLLVSAATLLGCAVGLIVGVRRSCLRA